MSALHGGSRDQLEISPNLWAGVGLVRGGAGTALVGDRETVAQRLLEYSDLGIETFILSGYPHLEESYRVAELLFPLRPIARKSSLPGEGKWRPSQATNSASSDKSFSRFWQKPLTYF